jgi:hypothetical protein
MVIRMKQKILLGPSILLFLWNRVIQKGLFKTENNLLKTKVRFISVDFRGDEPGALVCPRARTVGRTCAR